MQEAQETQATSSFGSWAVSDTARPLALRPGSRGRALVGEQVRVWGPIARRYASGAT
jgi:hypothetical protein